LEATGQLGGMATSGGVALLLGGRTADNKRQCVGGIFSEITRELAARGGAVDPQSIPEEKYPPYGWYRSLATGVPFDPEALAALLDEKMLEAGVEVLLFTSFVDVLTKNGRITHVIIFNKSGLSAGPVKAVVDSTGDADVAARSGCEVVKGRAEDGLMTPASLIFFVDQVDQDALAGYIQAHNSPRLRDIIQRLREAGEWAFPYDIFISVQSVEKGTMMINTTRLCGVDGTDGGSLSRGMVAGRKEVRQLFALMRKHFPGFEKARIKWIAPMLGVRETRRIVGDFVYTVADVLAGRDFEDTIGFSGYGWDLPDPKRPSLQPMHENKVRMKRPYTPIPYRCMVPRPIENLVCPGRAICVDRDVLGPLRVMAPCFAMGEAAGLAAAQVVREGIAFKEMDMPRLRETLRRNGAIVNMEE
jgi:hypothetical protein